ncbi:MAG: nicotinate-nucleotide adenylyltransferase [Candidatus Omnitrophota bacterium]
MKIGLFGGTFNPVHLGHLILAQEAWFKLGLEKVIFVPAYIPPHKELEGDISVADRLNLVRLSLEGDKRFEISTYEIDAKGTSYSIDTIKHFRGKEKYAELFFIIGSDSLETLSEWKGIEEILNLTVFVVGTRPGFGKTGPYEDKITRVDIPRTDISSSEIRRRIREKEPIDFLLKPAAVEYIRNKGLYLQHSA